MTPPPPRKRPPKKSATRSATYSAGTGTRADESETADEAEAVYHEARVDDQYSDTQAIDDRELVERLDEVTQEFKRRLDDDSERGADFPEGGGTGQRPPYVARPVVDESSVPEIQRFFGELHGFVDLVIRDPSLLPEEERRSLAGFYGEIAEAFGACQAALIEGIVTEDRLRELSLSGKPLRHKLRRWRLRLKQFVETRLPEPARLAIHPASLILGSAAAALPGVIGEPIKEALQGIDEILSDAEGTRSKSRP